VTGMDASLLVPVPEPGMLVLMASGLAGLALRSRMPRDSGQALRRLLS
jgi:hypothetical protein